MSRLLQPTFYTVIPSEESDVAASNEMTFLHGKDHYYPSPLALLVYALIIAVFSATCGLGIGMSLKKGEDTIPSWTRSLSRGTQDEFNSKSSIFQE